METVIALSLKKCLVVGAGIGGLGAAIALSRKGWEVDVVELKPDGAVAGVGINQPGNSLRALDALGVLDECLEAGFAFDRNTHYDWQGSLIVETTCQLGRGQIPANNALRRSALHDILTNAALSQGAAIRYGTTVEHFHDYGVQVDVQFTDGTRNEYDVVAAFDGIRSVMRRRLFGNGYEPAYTGYAVWRAMLPRLAAVDHTLLFHGDRSNTGLIPLSSTHMYLLHVCAESEEARYASADFKALLAQRLAGYGGLVAELRGRLPEDGIVYSPLNEVHLPPPWHRARVIVLGDGAHASAPNLTQGAAMALEDAVVLADELAVERPVEESLAVVTALRAPRAQLVQEVSHGILMAEMAVTADRLPQFADGLRAHLPGQAAFIEEQLNRPFRSVEGAPLPS